MKIENLRIKDNISLADKIGAIESIVSFYFSKDVDGEITYTPYYSDMGESVAIVNHFFDGISFNEKESVYQNILESDELRDLLSTFFSVESEVLSFIRDNVKDLVNLQKEMLIHQNKSMDKIAEFCDVVIGSLLNFSKLDLKALTPELIEKATKIINQLVEKDITYDLLVDVVKDAVAFDVDKVNTDIVEDIRVDNFNLRKINTEKDKIIASLTHYKNKNEAKNILSDEIGK